MMKHKAAVKYGLLGTVLAMGIGLIASTALGAAHESTSPKHIASDYAHCRSVCEKLLDYEHRHCEKIDPKDGKAREACFRRAKQDFANCIWDCEKERSGGKCR